MLSRSAAAKSTRVEVKRLFSRSIPSLVSPSCLYSSPSQPYPYQPPAPPHSVPSAPHPSPLQKAAEPSTGAVGGLGGVGGAFAHAIADNAESAVPPSVQFTRRSTSWIPLLVASIVGWISMFGLGTREDCISSTSSISLGILASSACAGTGAGGGERIWSPG